MDKREIPLLMTHPASLGCLSVIPPGAEQDPDPNPSAASPSRTDLSEVASTPCYTTFNTDESVPQLVIRVIYTEVFLAK